MIFSRLYNREDFSEEAVESKHLGGHYAELPVDKLLGNDYNKGGLRRTPLVGHYNPLAPLEENPNAPFRT